MATLLTFGNPLKFGLDSCHNAKGRSTFLHRERERERERAPKAPREHPRHHPFERGLPTGPRACGSCRHGRWSNEGTAMVVFHSRSRLGIDNMHEACARRPWACVCICVYAYACPRVFRGLSFPKIVYLVKKIVLFSTNTFLKSIFIWSGPKPTSGFGILTSLRNGCSTYKG